MKLSELRTNTEQLRSTGLSLRQQLVQHSLDAIGKKLEEHLARDENPLGRWLVVPHPPGLNALLAKVFVADLRERLSTPEGEGGCGYRVDGFQLEWRNESSDTNAGSNRVLVKLRDPNAKESVFQRLTRWL